MAKAGKYGDEERKFLEKLAQSVNSNKLSFNDAVRRAVEELDRSEKGVALYMGRICRRVAGNVTRQRRSTRMPGVDAKPGDLVRVIQSLSAEYKSLSSQRDALTKRLDEVEERLRVLKDRLLSNLGISD